MFKTNLFRVKSVGNGKVSKGNCFFKRPCYILTLIKVSLKEYALRRSK
jgi:hypothetical protein